MSKKAIFDAKNILITGGAGFIGSHLCDELVKDNKVICMDNFSTGDEINIDHLLSNPNFEFIRHDISEPIDLDSLAELQKFKIQFQGIQEIYHLACPTSPKNFKENIQATLLANSHGMKNVLDMAIKYRAKLMHFSSSVIYGPRREGNPRIKEGDSGIVNPLSERSSYDEGKRFAETFVHNYRKLFNIDAKIIRLFRIYGPRMKLADSQMIPDFIDSALDNRELLILGDEKFTSSFCYIGDVVDAVVKLMETDLSGPFNIGSDVEINIRDVAQVIIDQIGAKSEIKYTDAHMFLTPLCMPDITAIREAIGWMPIVSLDRGLEKTISHLRASKGLKEVKHAL